MYAKAYYMPGKIEYCKEKRRGNLWVLPVFFCTIIVLGAVFAMLGYFAVKESEVQGLYQEVAEDMMVQEVVVEQMTKQEQEQVLESLVEPQIPQEVQEPQRVTEQIVVPTAEPIVSPKPFKTMYLTFDDGPSAEYTDTILDVLSKYDVKATFFLVGENVEKRPEVAKRIAQEGHTIGIHCYSHAYNELYDSVESFVADFEKAYNIIYETTGVEAKIFRFPGGSVNGYNKHVYKDIIAEMEEKGFIYFDWNASLEDAVKKTSPEQLVQNAKETAMERERVIMLAHDTIYNTSLCIEDIILQFPEYKMEPLNEEVVPIRFRLD